MTDADIRELVRHGATIEAIRRHRARHGGTLLAARAAIEALRWEFTQASGPALSAFEAEIDQLLRSEQKSRRSSASARSTASASRRRRTPSTRAPRRWRGAAETGRGS
ncbi:hypothetical protein OV079_13630 [Nannocystis pusilla]|uniref:Uncharacterized protein n=1 Tax=Nannocystis pusilla TaxID=889268 RepID=A0A9X3EMP0_9BACT|nr:hypothetical protein [Nannocystis pusilla]MCY1006575.1 hypothetical protein [Nannocystis pusilla]